MQTETNAKRIHPDIVPWMDNIRS